MFRNLEQYVRERSSWLAAQRHGGLFGGAVAFLDVAFQASGGDIVPGVTTPSGTGDDVVYGQVMASYTTVLTGVAVPVENISS